ncbi:MAG TPA: hypothetical protein VFM71_01810 [Gemmatimonadaceae bacterium]|nr:hypothetical protein [Gemmatimonadaceae bacterium]
MDAAHEARAGNADSVAIDVMLSVLFPGLGQLNQRRFVAAALFIAIAVASLAAMVAAPNLRALGLAGALGVTLWSAVDAFRGRSNVD